MKSEFEEMCESFGVMKSTKRVMYPRQIKLSEEFLKALKNEWFKGKLEEDVEAPVKNKPAKFLKALQFHVADFEKNSATEVEAYKRMMEEAKFVKYEYDENGKRMKVSDDVKKKSDHTTSPMKKKKVEEETSPEQTSTDFKSGQPTGNKKVSEKKEIRRKSEIKRQNMDDKEYGDAPGDDEYRQYKQDNKGYGHNKGYGYNKGSLESFRKRYKL